MVENGLHIWMRTDVDEATIYPSILIDMFVLVGELIVGNANGFWIGGWFSVANYDFRCGSSQCSAVFEVCLPMDDRDRACISCPDCGSEARRQVVPSRAPACIIMKKQETSDKQIPERLLP